MLTSHYIRATVIFAAAGLLSRFTFRHVETRKQILVFWGLVAVYQLVLRPAFGRRVSPASMAVDLLAVTVAVLGMKIAIEGQVWP